MLGILTLSLLVSCAQKKDVDAIDARVKALEDKVATMEAKGAAAAPASSADEDAASKLMQAAQTAIKDGDYATAKTNFASLAAKYPATRAGKAASHMAGEVNLIGTDAKPIEVDKWFQGKADYSGGKATLMVFWEVWCPHCKKEIPELAAKEAEYKAKGIQIVSLTKVTKSATDDKVMEFLKENKVKFPVGKEKDMSMSTAFNVSGIPAAALVKDGKVVWRGHPSRLTPELLDKLMAG